MIPPRIAVWLAWVLWTLCVLAWALATVLASLTGVPADVGEVLFGLGLLVYPTIGALVAARHPQNPVGWLLLAGALALSLNQFAGIYATYALVKHRGALPGGVAAGWLTFWGGNFGFALLLLFTPLVFPTGRLMSRRWWAIAWLGVITVAMRFIAEALAPGPMRTFPVDNPLGLKGATDTLARVEQIGLMLLSCTAITALGSLLLRFRRAYGEERQQLKWLVYATTLLIILFAAVPLAVTVVTIPEIVLNLAFAIAVIGLPIAIGMAMLKNRLYDIDIIINRTLVYGTVTALLALLYWGSIVLLQQLFRPLIGPGNDLAIVASTLAIAIMFQPLRRRIQATIDRRFYRRKYDAAKTLAAFSARLRDEVDLNVLTADLVDVVEETLQPVHVSLWLRDSGARSGIGRRASVDYKPWADRSDVPGG